MTTNTKKTNRQKTVQEIKQFRGKVTSLMGRGFEYIGMARVSVSYTHLTLPTKLEV